MRSVELMVGLQHDLGDVMVSRRAGYKAQILALAQFDNLVVLGMDQQEWDRDPSDVLVRPRTFRLGRRERPPCPERVDLDYGAAGASAHAPCG